MPTAKPLLCIHATRIRYMLMSVLIAHTERVAHSVLQFNKGKLKHVKSGPRRGPLFTFIATVSERMNNYHKYIVGVHNPPLQ